MKITKQWTMIVVICFFYLFSVMLTAETANAAAKVTWGKVGKGSYSELSPYTLNWTGNVLSQGGYSLSDMDVTTSSKDADFVITQSGYIAANAIIKVNEQLQDMTDASISNFKTYENVTQGAVYLIILNDGTWAKLKIDTVIKSYMDYISKVTFSYVIEDEVIEDKPNNQNPSNNYKPGQFAKDVEQGLYDDNPFADPAFDLRYPGAEYTFEEGPIVISFPAKKGQIAFDVYRSDNGGPYVPVSDFILEEPEFTDYYAFAGHTYLYIFVAYDQYGVSEIDLPIKLNVIAEGTSNTDNTNTGNTNKGNLKIVMKLDSTTALVGDKKMTLDVAPVVVHGRTLVPVRFISEALGAKVDWDNKTRTSTILLGDKKISLQLDSSVAVVNGKKVTMDVPATTIKGRTMVPIRFVSENLNLDIKFNNNTREITILNNNSSGSNSNSNSGSNSNSNQQYQPQPSNAYDELVGIWDMWVPSADRNVPSSSGGILIIYENMTWEHSIGNKVTSGDIDVENGRYVLLNYNYGWDWSITASSDGIYVSSAPAYQVGTPAKLY